MRRNAAGGGISHRPRLNSAWIEPASIDDTITRPFAERPRIAVQAYQRPLVASQHDRHGFSPRPSIVEGLYRGMHGLRGPSRRTAEPEYARGSRPVHSVAMRVEVHLHA